MNRATRFRANFRRGDLVDNGAHLATDKALILLEQCLTRIPAVIAEALCC
jgi:hypothetical protein